MIADSRFRILAPSLYLLGLAFILVGYLGPWVPHETAALTVTGLELAEFAKFFPQVQGGVVSIMRALFYLPFVVALIFFSLFVSRSTVPSVRLIVSLLVIALLIVTLLPYFVIDGMRHALATRSAFAIDSQYAKQLLLLIAGMMLVLLTPLAHRFPRRVIGVLVMLLALVGAAPTIWQFVLLYPLVVALYHDSLRLGWGLTACMIGFVLLFVSGFLDLTSLEASVDE